MIFVIPAARYRSDAAPMVYACMLRQMFHDDLVAIAHNCGTRGEEMTATGIVSSASDRGRMDAIDLVDVA